jgi:uncharacterized damage-inducible protein DinB
MRRIHAHIICSALVLALAPVARGQMANAAKGPDMASNPISAVLDRQYEQVKGNIMKSADEMPDADYAFKPTPEVRSYGELIAHIAQGEYMSCAAAKGEKAPMEEGQAAPSAKADLVTMLHKAFDYCDPLYTGSSDAALIQSVTMGTRKTIRYAALSGNVGHANEHYGNIVTYLRLKGHVPPSSQRAPVAATSGR